MKATYITIALLACCAYTNAQDVATSKKVSSPQELIVPVEISMETTKDITVIQSEKKMNSAVETKKYVERKEATIESTEPVMQSTKRKPE